MKKRKRIKVKYERRTISLAINTANSFNRLQVNSSTGLCTAFMDGEPVEDAFDGGYVQVSYGRKKGKKIILKFPQFGKVLYKSPLAFVWHYDVVFAVDTNTRTIAGEEHSVGAMSILRCLENNITDGGASDSLKMSMNMFGALIKGKNIRGKIENWFWKVAIEDGIKKLWPEYSAETRIGLVVDSDLGHMQDFNERRLPIYEDYFLPENIYLLYASTDTGADLLLNQLIKLCDKESSLQLGAISRGEKPVEVFTELRGEKAISLPGVPFRFYQKP